MKHEDFLENGFEKDNDPMFYYRKELISKEFVEENNIEEDEIPCLLYGSTQINRGFCIYTGEHFIWLNSQTIEDAVAFSEKIIAFESV